MKSTRPDIWPNLLEKSKNWSDEEKNRVLEALSEIPEELWSDKVKTIFRSAKSKDFPNPASNVDGHIALYDTAFNDTKERNLTRVLVHELAHSLSQSLKKSIVDSYNEVAKWESVTDPKLQKRYIYRRRYGFVEEDGKNSAEEDFSNNLEYFIFDPDKLKRVNEPIYNWMKKNYGIALKKGK